MQLFWFSSCTLLKNYSHGVLDHTQTKFPSFCNVNITTCASYVTLAMVKVRRGQRNHNNYLYTKTLIHSDHKNAKLQHIAHTPYPTWEHPTGWLHKWVKPQPALSLVGSLPCLNYNHLVTSQEGVFHEFFSTPQAACWNNRLQWK